MPNPSLFASTPGQLPAEADAINNAGGKAYAMSPKHALTQYALTGTFNDTYYVSAEVQLEKVLKLCEGVDHQYIAQLAAYARHEGFMKDVPAFLLAYLSTTDYPKLTELFGLVINNGKMLRNYVQMIRSGVTGRKSLGTKLRRLVRDWLLHADDNAILQATIGNTPSLSDVIKMVHPKPIDTTRAALFAWVIGKPYDAAYLPPAIKQYIEFIALPEEDRLKAELPTVPFLMLTSMKLSVAQWNQLIGTMSWTQLRMNLNTFQRNGVFEDRAVTNLVAGRLADKYSVLRAHAFPYQIMTTYQAVKGNVPDQISGALHDALEYSVANVPVIEGNLALLIDTSSSMGSNKVMKARNGNVENPTTCTDVAGLMAASLLRKNPNCLPIAFDTQVYDLRPVLEARDTVMTNAIKLGKIRGGGTDCALPIMTLCHIADKDKALFDTVIMISDNESWVDANPNPWRRGTSSEAAWNAYKVKNPNAKLICIDIVPNDSVQVKERDGVINIGGFSDNVFKLISQVVTGQANANRMVAEVESVMF